MKRILVIVHVLALALLAGRPSAQHPSRPKQFQAGEIFLSVGGTNGCDSTVPGIVRIDPRTYGSTLLRNLNVQSEWIGYDPYRDRLMAHGSTGLLLIGRHGGLATIAPGLVIRGASSAGDGRIYLDVNGSLWCLDRDDILKPVIDARNPQLSRAAYHLGGGSGDMIAYHEDTGDLYFLTNYASCPPSGSVSRIHRLQLARNGMAVIGATASIVGTCGLTALSLDRGPSEYGLFSPPSSSLLVVETTGGEMRAYTIDAVTLTRQMFASWTGGYRGFGDGAYSEYLGAAIIYGTEIDVSGPIAQLWALPEGSVDLSGAERLYQSSPPSFCPFGNVRDIEIIR